MMEQDGARPSQGSVRSNEPHSGQWITERLNDVYDGDDSASALDEDLLALQVRSLLGGEWT